MGEMERRREREGEGRDKEGEKEGGGYKSVTKGTREHSRLPN